MAILAFTGCSTLPASGPYSSDMHAKEPLKQTKPTMYSAKPSIDFEIIELTSEISNYFGNLPKEYFGTYDWPTDSKSVPIRIAVGDTVQVTIYEVDSGGLFVPTEAGVRPGNFVTIPSQVVDKTGAIEVPFAGSIQVVGRTSQSVATEIQKKLGSRAKEPQAVVTVTERAGSEVSVIGAVNQATRYSLNFGGERILDAIARAQGPLNPGYETIVSLQRGGKEWKTPFDILVDFPESNIHLHPGDTIYLNRQPEMFQLFGAAGFSGAYPFLKKEITLAEAIGQGRGLNDSLADPSEIYLYRNEYKGHLYSLGFEIGQEPDKNLAQTLPVIFKLDLRDPEGFFMAQSFKVEDKDIIYIANAKAAEFTKFLNLLNSSSITKFNSQTAVEQ